MTKLLRLQNVYRSLTSCQKCFSSATNATKLSYSHKNGNQPLINQTLGQVVDKSAEVYGTNEAMIFRESNTRKNFIQFKNDVDNFAAGLIAIGLKKGERIGILSPNIYEWIVTQFASAKAGLILVNINPANQARELHYCLKKVGVRALVSKDQFKTQNYYELLKTIAPSIQTSSPGQIKDDSLDLTHLIIISDKDYDGTFKFSDVRSLANDSHFKILDELQTAISFEDAVNIQFTSGTSGTPKAATLSHFGLINNAYSVAERLGFLNKLHRLCIPTPLYHSFASGCGSITALKFGVCQVYPSSSVSAELTAKAIHEEKCTVVYGTPTMYIDILDLPNVSDYDFSRIEAGVLGGAPAPPELIKILESKLKMNGIVSGYGSTESSPGIAMAYCNDSLEKRSTTVGKVFDNSEIKIVNTDTQEIALRGQVGEICTRGSSVMIGYWDEPEKTKECIVNGWYKTGDLGIMDESGYIKLIGRLKDMIIRGGENIYPTEIEGFLHTHPKIAEAHVFGIPDDRLGEEVCVYVRLNSGSAMTEKEVKEFCSQQLAYFKIPRYIKFVERFVTSGTGKVQKNSLRDLAIKEFKLTKPVAS